MLTRLLPTLLIAAGLALAGCSDDSEEKDAGVPDAGKDTTTYLDTGSDVYDPDFGPDDLAPDQPVPDADPGKPSKWKEVQSGLSDALYDVWPISASKVIAVGKSGLIMMYDGTSWSSTANPDTDKNTLRALGEGGSYVFAVGDATDLNYNGTTWAKGYSYATSYALQGIHGAKSGSYMFAVDLGSSYPYIRYRSKSSPTSSWSSIYLSSSAPSLYAVWAATDSDVFVVGEKGTIMHCTSTCTNYSSTWTTMTSGVTSDLKAIWGTSNKDLFAVGFDGTIIHYDGTKWTKMTSGTNSYFYGVWGSSGTNVFAVGHPIFKTDEAIFRYDGTKWTKMVTPHTTFLEAVRGTSATDVWAVGKTHILHYDGK
jgi:photosystem II stability/assembly factor-like uncharacterized protein